MVLIQKKIAKHNLAKGTIAVIIGAVVNFTLNIFYVTRWKSIGIAVTTVVAESAVTLVHLYYVRKYVSLSAIFLIFPFILCLQQFFY